MGREVVFCGRLGDRALAQHLIPVANCPEVAKLWIVRHARITTCDVPKAEYLVVAHRFKVIRFLQMLRVCRRLAQRPEVEAFVSFNPFPYGLFSLWATRSRATPVHFGFVGSDWNLMLKGRFGKWLLRYVRRCDFITCTGPSMRDEMVARGLDPHRIEVLPHTVNLESYPLADSAQASYSSIFVGHLLPLKQVDVILKGWAKVSEDLSEARFAVVGDGPEGQRLQQLARDLGLESKVDFPGQVTDVAGWYARARTIVIASTHEGLPFVLVEAMACGVVPVTTPVGTIPDFLTDGDDSRFFPVGDPRALATVLTSLLRSPRRYDDIRRRVVARRGRLGRDQATAVWRAWLGRRGRAVAAPPTLPT